MSSWLAALGPCASPKSKAKERKGDGTLVRPANLSSLKRRGSLTDIRNSRKVTGSRSFRERLQDTFDGSLRRAKKAGSLEAVNQSLGSHTFANPDTNMNLASSLSPKSSRSFNSKSPGIHFQDHEPMTVEDKFWTNFYNTLPRNRQKGDRPKDLSLQDLPITEREADTEDMISQTTEVQIEPRPTTEIKWQGYATSPRTKRKAKTLERMNSAPSTRISPMLKTYDGEPRAGSDGQASPQIIDSSEQVFDIHGQEYIVMPRSVSLQDEYWMPATKGGSKIELRRVTPSPTDRLMVRHSPSGSGGSPVHIQGGHIWVKSKDGTHMELHAVDRIARDIPSPSESQNTESSGFSYTTAASSISNLETVPRFPVEDRLPTVKGSASSQSSSDYPYSVPYMSPEEYQANIFDLIQSLNHSKSNPSSPEVKRSTEVKHNQQAMAMSPTEDSRTFHSEKYILLGSSAAANRQEGGIPEKREQPIFSVRAHVFQIDPETKKNWLPASKTAVAVSYYYDSARNTYRIISVEGSKAIINSTITPNMAFTKTSQKFGQWSDPRANTVYGLGFGSESDLAKFIEKFKEVKEMTRQQVASQSQSPTTVNGISDDSHSSSTTPRETQHDTPPNRGFFHTRSSSLTSMREPVPQNDQKENINLRERRNSFNTPGSNGTTNSNSPESQLKYENDRLKLALAQSSANAKKWEIELQTLKNNNARLTAALQESTTNVDEWKKQLAAYKDESSRMKKKLSELEKRQGNTDEVSALQSEITHMNDTMEALQRDNHYKDEEVDRLQQRLAEMATRETANGNLQNKLKVDDVKALEEENRLLQQKVHDLQQLLEHHKQSQDRDKDEVLNLQDTLGSKITELYEFHEQIMATIRKESTS